MIRGERAEASPRAGVGEDLLWPPLCSAAWGQAHAAPSRPTGLWRERESKGSTQAAPGSLSEPLLPKLDTGNTTEWGAVCEDGN